MWSLGCSLHEITVVKKGTVVIIYNIVIACVDIIYNIQHDNTRTPSSRALLAFATAHIAYHFPPNKTKWKRRAGNIDREEGAGVNIRSGPGLALFFEMK